MTPHVTVFADESACIAHDPFFENVLGAKEGYRESPRRLAGLLSLFRSHAAVYDILDSHDHGLKPILACHDEHYVAFLRDCYAEWIAEGGSEDGVVSRIAYHPHFAALSQGVLPDPASLSLDGRIGLFSWDLGHTVTKDTFRASYAAAQVAASAADHLLECAQDGPSFVFAATTTGGYCYINNASVAARRLQAGQPSTKIAILDLDAHFGNGTADIFASDPSVLYTSLHADKTFPHFGGQAEQDGLGKGKGFTRNFPLPVGATQETYLETLDKALGCVANFAPTYLVLSLGVDTYEHDPFNLFKIKEAGYALMAKRVARLSLPTCIIMEGGYNVDALPKLFHSFLTSFAAERLAPNRGA